MKHQNFISAILLITICNFSLKAQQLFSNGGSSNIQHQYSIGEPIIGFANDMNNQVTVGFHQSNLTVTGIHDSNYYKPIIAFPNPTNDELNIQIDNNNELLKILVLNSEGQIVSSYNMTSDVSSISFKSLASGTYFLQILNSENNKFKTHKIIKSN